METIFQLYAYLKQNDNSQLGLDPSYSQVDRKSFQKADWTDFYGDMSEVIPNNAPEPRDRRSNCVCLSSQITLMTRSERDQEKGSVYSLSWHV